MKRMWGEFLSDTVVVLGLGSLVNVLNYIFVLIAAQSFSTADFGTCSALLACVTISAVAGNALQLRVTQALAERSSGLLWTYVGRMLRRLALVGIGCGVTLAFAAGPLSAAIHAQVVEVGLTGLAVVGVLFHGFANGLTSGLRWLKTQAWIGFASTVAKLLLLIALVRWGIGTPGALVAYAVGVWLVLPLSLWVTFRWRPVLPEEVTAVASNAGHGVVVFLSYLLITAPFMLDQILVQSFAQPFSGLYGALATLGKLVFYGCAPVICVVFPYIVTSRHEPSAQRHYEALGAAVTLGGAALIAMLVGGQSDLFVGLLLSPQYAAITSLVATSAIGVLMYVVAYFETVVWIAKGDRWVLVPLCIGIAAQVFLFSTRAQSLEALAENQLWGYAVLCSALVLYRLIAVVLKKQRERIEGAAPAGKVC